MSSATTSTSSTSAESPCPYPSDWESDSKMGAYFDTLPEKGADDERRLAMIAFWKKVLSDIQNHRFHTKRRLTFSSTELKSLVLRRGEPPLCFSRVLLSLLNSGDLATSHQVASRLAEKSSFASRALSYLLSFVVSSDYSSLPENERFFFTAQLKEESDAIYQSITKSALIAADLIFPVHELLQRTRIDSEDDLDLLMQQLSLDGKATSETATSGTISSPLTASSSSSSSSSARPKVWKFKGAKDVTLFPMNSKEYAIGQLKSSTHGIEQQITQLNEQICLKEQEIRMLMKQKKKTAALHALRSKKMLDKHLETRTSMLNNMQLTLDSLLNAVMDKESIDALKQAAQALKSQRESAEEAQEVMLEVSEGVEETEKVSSALTEDIRPSSEEEKDALEKEFEALAKSEDVKQKPSIEQKSTAERVLKPAESFASTSSTSSASTSVISSTAATSSSKRVVLNS
eukprot:TRINITY_DN675_c2_g1_i1.p1 TRINITY_DN675_c2_g1~~TRINITY_DN675_c2_g1_i1.p1  ORF type:complete len:460 (+),score=114.85 TRINITY_DN675_c2_g1_i1:58-1437(+)